MDQAVLKKTGLLRNKFGFTFVELIVAIALIGVMALVVVPYFRGRDTGKDRQEFVSGLNHFVAGARYNAILSGKNQKVVFDLENFQVWVEQQVGQKNAQGEELYEKVQADYSESLFGWDNQKIKIKDVLINGKNAILSSDGISDKVWFFVVPDGNAQNVTINFRDEVESDKYGEPSYYHLILNPFSVQFKLYESL